jgi:acetylornithine deacetylase/succinyl-diaminopimelate desuccinylase-like protein
MPCTHATVTPTVMRAGVNTNVIPDSAEVGVDVRALPEQTRENIRGMIAAALGEISDDIDVVVDHGHDGSSSSLDTPLWDSLRRVAGSLSPGATTVPLLMPGFTDARFFRRLGATAYGFALYSDRISLADILSRIHAHDERIDQESLRLCTELWIAVARDLLS